MNNRRALWTAAAITALVMPAVIILGLRWSSTAKERAVAPPRHETRAAPPETTATAATTATTATIAPSVPVPAVVPAKRPNAFAPDLKKALELYRKGDYTACIEAAHRVTDAVAAGTNPADVADAKELAAAAAMLQALAHHRQAQPEEALKFWEKVAQEKDNDLAPIATLLKGYERLLYGQSDEAEKIFEQVATDFVPSQAAGTAALWVKLNIITGIKEIAAKNEATPPALTPTAKPSEEIEKFLAAIPAVGKEEKLTPEAETRFKELLDKAHECDDAFPMPRNIKRDLDAKKALDYYLQALQAKPAAGNDAQIMLRVARLYSGEAHRPGAGAAILQDALPMARQAVKLTSPTTAQGLFARMARFGLLRLSRNFMALCEEEESAAQALMAPDILQKLPQEERQLVGQLRSQVITMFVRDCSLTINSYPLPQQVLARTARAFPQTDLGSAAVTGLEEITYSMALLVMRRNGTSWSVQYENFAFKSLEGQVLEAVESQVYQRF